MPTKLVPTSTHWGHYQIEVDGEEIKGVHAYQTEQAPAPIAQSLHDITDKGARVAQPMVRASFLEKGVNSNRTLRGREPFVAISWEQAFDLVASELKRVAETHGNEAIYAGSYGWGSPGALHFPRWNMHQLLNLNGGFTDSVGSYSTAASEAITKYILDDNGGLVFDAPAWSDIAENAELVVLFGGTRVNNSQVSFGGLGAHTPEAGMKQAREAGVQFINIGPIRDDVTLELGAEWYAPRPNTDTAIMLAMAHTLVSENLVDQAFVDTYTVGFDRFRPYLLGKTDGQPKDAEWAEAISALPAETIKALARRMAASKTLISVSWAVQRAEHGEQPYWMAVVLASMLGQIGLPGRGVTFGLNAMHALGSSKRPLLGWPSRPAGQNPINSKIPVSRITDMLLNPGQPFQFDGEDLTYPNIQLIYWVGGNPFHHHQDLNRLIKAWQKPETIIINEPFWTATARYADIVLPANTALERNDINFTLLDATITPMRQAVPSYKQARSDYDIFLGIAERLGVAEAYSEGRDEMGWLRHFYEEAIKQAADKGVTLPDFETFWLGEQLQVGGETRRKANVERFREDPSGAPLSTPTGKIEIFSETLNGYGYDNCLGHPAWLPPGEWLGAEIAEKYPLHLLSNQPKTRLHSQLDHARVSLGGKQNGREVARMHPEAAATRGISDGDFIRLFNDRGACLAVVSLSDQVHPDVIQLSTGAWYNPADPHINNGLEIHGNPNVLTRDVGTSKLGQGPSPNSTLVDVEKYTGMIPPITVHQPPEIIYKGAV